MMNSLLICPEYFDGRLNGIGRVSEAICETLSAAAFSTEVWSANEAKGAAEFGFGRAFGRNYYRMILAGVFSPAKGVGLVGAVHLGLSPVARLVAWRRRCPYFVFIHGVEAWKPLRARSRWGLKGARVLLFNSRHTLLRFGKVNPSLANLPSKVVELGVTEPERLAVPANGSFQILCVTRLTKSCSRKNIRVLIDALAEVGASCPKARLVVVGDGNDRQDLELYAKARLASERYFFTGKISDKEVAHWRNRSAVFALPSEQEGFGLVFAEAMAAGLPCVCGSTDASSEVVENGVTGFCVNPRKPKEVAAALLQVLTDQVLRDRMSAAARSRFEHIYTKAAFQIRFKAALQEYNLLS
jgi:phosphatidylinositol alpha-1,6-mannosyltransferase